MFDIEYYKLPNGRKPVADFIDGLETKMRVKAFSSIDVLAHYGNTIREPYSKAMGGGIFELRIKFSSDITRIFYFFFVGKKIVLTNGIVKKSRVTPPGALELAQEYKADYERRHPHG